MRLFRRKKEVKPDDLIEKLKKELVSLEEKAKVEAELKEKQKLIEEQKKKELEESKQKKKVKVPKIKRKNGFFSRRLTEKEKAMLEDYEKGRILQIDNNIDNKLYFSERK